MNIKRFFYGEDKEGRLLDGKEGEYRGKIEEIGISMFGNTDTLYLSNGRMNLWLGSLFSGYRQIGKFKVERPHDFYEGQGVIVTKVDGKITEVVGE